MLDAVDGDLLILLGLSDPVYQQVDKSADYVTYVCMVAAAWRWRYGQELWIAARRDQAAYLS